MSKKTIIALLVLLLTACASNPEVSDDSKETIYQKTRNYAQLVELYKSQLQREDTGVIREKLARSYLDYGDAESALLYLKPIITNDSPTTEALLLNAQAMGALGLYPAAINSAQKALENEPENARAEILLGSFYGAQYQYELARAYFERARAHFADGAIVQNNLAVIDIAQGHYQQASDRLLPLYRNGQADEKIIANLTLSMAKQGHFSFVEHVLSDRYSKHQINNIYRALRAYEPIKATPKQHVLTGVTREV